MNQINQTSLILRKKYLEEQVVKYQNILATGEKGNLIARRQKDNSYKYYEYSNLLKKEKYLSKDKREYAENLGLTAYAENVLKDLYAEIRALEQVLDCYQRESKAKNYLENHPGVAELIAPKLRPQSDYVKNWMNETYIRNTKYQQFLKYPTVIPSLKVRSKAESDWVSRLVHFGVPLRYEELAICNDYAYHPDFTCLNIRSYKKYYIEHQGGWDQESYVDKLPDRMQNMRKAGIIPWKNLIITTETEDEPLDINWIDELIEYFLLS